MKIFKLGLSITFGLLIISCNTKLKEEKILTSINNEDTLRNYAMQTKVVLGKNLMNAINKQGTEKAIEFCSTKALVLTDSMGKALKATIKRVSDQPRNPLNLANEDEIAFIKELKEKMAKSEKLTSKISEANGKTIAYFPIETNAMCLQCHGSKDSDIKPNVLKKIDLLYPKDQAIGYKENQIRGIFVVTQNN